MNRRAYSLAVSSFILGLFLCGSGVLYADSKVTVLKRISPTLRIILRGESKVWQKLVLIKGARTWVDQKDV